MECSTNSIFSSCPITFPTISSCLRRVNYYGDKWQEKEILKDLRWLAGEK
jgi:hypothetical protein